MVRGDKGRSPTTIRSESKGLKGLSALPLALTLPLPQDPPTAPLTALSKVRATV